MAVASANGFDCEFVGARREASLSEVGSWEGVSIVRIGPFFPLLNGRRPVRYISGVLGYCIAMVRYLIRERPTLIHLSDFEIGLFGSVIGRLMGMRIVYNIHDNLAERYRVSRPIRRLLSWCEGLAVIMSHQTMVPEGFRRDLLPRWCRKKIVVARNSPGDPGYSPPTGPHSPPRILFAGWLDWGRGLRQLLELARRGQISLVLAGNGDDDITTVAKQTPNTKFLGFIGHSEIIRLTAAADYVAAFYDPARPINRYAASNKIAEALAVGRPVLTNSEVMVSLSLAKAGAAVVIDYDELLRLADVLEAVREGGQYETLCEAARRMFLQAYHPSVVESATLDALLR